MFGPKKISQSLIDAVLKVTEDKTEVTQAPQLLDEADKVPTPTGMKVYGSRYGNSAKARRDQTKAAVDTLKGPKDKELIKDDEIDETGFHKAAHGAKKAGQSHFEFQGKKYPVTAKSHAEAVEEEEGDCVTKPQAKDIAKKEVGKHEKGMHGKSGEVAKHEKKMHKEGMSFKERLLEREMTSAESRKKEKIVMSMKDKQEYFKKKYGKKWKEVMYATATKQAMKEQTSIVDEEVELDEEDTKVKHVHHNGEKIGETGVDSEASPGGGKWFAKHYKSKMDSVGFDSRKEAEAEVRAAHGIKEEAELEETKMTDLQKKAAKYDFTKTKSGREVPKQKKPFRMGNEPIGKMKEEVEEIQQEAVKKSDVPAFLRKMRGDKPLTMKDVKSGDKDSISHKDNLAKARNEEFELTEKNDSHTHAAHYENEKGEWTGMNLFTAKDDTDAIKQAQAKCKEGCRLSKVERHTTVKEDVEVIQDKNGHKTTTDMLSGRHEGGKLNSFKNFKVNLVVSGEEEIPTEVDKGEDTKEKQKITTNPGPVDIKFDDKLVTPPHKYFSSQESITSEEVRGELKHIRSKEKAMRNKEVSQFASHKATKTTQTEEEVQEAKDPHMDAGVGAQPDFATEKVIAGVDGWKKVQKNVQDKSGAVHTPHSRAKDLAKQAFKKVKSEMLGKAPGNN
jgi:hypothetical protein